MSRSVSSTNNFSADEQFYILNLEKQLGYLTTDYNTFYNTYYDGSAGFSHSNAENEKPKKINYNIINKMNGFMDRFSSFDYGKDKSCHKFTKTLNQVLENTITMIRYQQRLTASLSNYKCNPIKQFFNDYTTGCNYDSILKDRRYMNANIAKIRLRIFKFIINSYLFQFMHGLQGHTVASGGAVDVNYANCKPDKYKVVLQEFIKLTDTLSDYLHKSGAADTLKALNLDKNELDRIIKDGHYKRLNKIDSAVEIGALFVGSSSGVTPLIKMMGAVPKNAGRLKRMLYSTRDTVVGEISIPLAFVGGATTANYINNLNLFTSETLAFMDNDNLNKQDLNYLQQLFNNYYTSQLNLKEKDLINMTKANENKCEYVNKVYMELENTLSNCPGCTSRLNFTNSDLTLAIKKTVEACN